jgi:hypothetical protein
MGFSTAGTALAITISTSMIMALMQRRGGGKETVFIDGFAQTRGKERKKERGKKL